MQICMLELTFIHNLHTFKILFYYYFCYFLNSLCREKGIRTPGGLTLNGFQDRRNRPLCHLSNYEHKGNALFLTCKLRLTFFHIFFFSYQK